MLAGTRSADGIKMADKITAVKTVSCGKNTYDNIYANNIEEMWCQLHLIHLRLDYLDCYGDVRINWLIEMMDS